MTWEGGIPLSPVRVHTRSSPLVIGMGLKITAPAVTFPTVQVQFIRFRGAAEQQGGGRSQEGALSPPRLGLGASQPASQGAWQSQQLC